jgi:hypothetical protein
MSDHELDAGETIMLRDTIDALRADVEVSDEWRVRVLREVGSLPAPRRSTARLILAFDARSTPNGAAHARLHRPGRRRIVLAAAATAVLMAGAVVGYRAWERGAPERGRPERGAPARLITASPAVTVNEHFTIAAPGAEHVSLVGDFNQWQAGATPLNRVDDGKSWEVQLALPPGRHVYAFVVDGKLVADPSAPRAADDDFGFPNSVALVAVSN